MSRYKELSDEEFVPFLRNLGVETYKKSFEWMLSDAKFAGVFSWLYNNLDQNNALTPREEYRYAELEKGGFLLSEEDLESTLLAIQQDYPGICVPGDNESLEDVKLDILMQKEKLAALEKQERVLKELIKQNELIKEQLTIDVTKLNAAEQQLAEDESLAGQECVTLADEVETLTEGVVDVIARALDVYANCHVDKDLSKKFVFFGPLDAYRQSQALFRSHFDLYTARKFNKKYSVSFTEDDHRSIMVEAKVLEDRLSEAALKYVDSKVELCSEQAKLALATNYNNVHPSQITMLSVEAMTAIEMQRQEESILEQQVQAAVRDMVAKRTKLALDTATNTVLTNRQQIVADLSHLLEVSETALCLDRILYCALRAELHSVTQCVQFAAQLHEYVESETAPIATRIQSMHEIISQQQTSLDRLQSTDRLVKTLCAILGASSVEDVGTLVKIFGDLHNKVRGLEGDVKEGYRKKMQTLQDFKNATRPLRDYVYDGCTRQPRGTDRSVSTLAHSLTRQLEAAENTVVQLGVHFTTVKNGDKQNLRKLWQWFLTDPPRLLAAVRGIQTGRLS